MPGAEGTSISVRLSYLPSIVTCPSNRNDLLAGPSPPPTKCGIVANHNERTRSWRWEAISAGGVLGGKVTGAPM
jgi:hypothetical protein